MKIPVNGYEWTQRLLYKSWSTLTNLKKAELFISLLSSIQNKACYQGDIDGYRIFSWHMIDLGPNNQPKLNSTSCNNVYTIGVETSITKK